MSRSEALWRESLREWLSGGSEYTVESAPYLRDGVNIQRYMAMPVLAALPATLGAIYFFGWHVLVVLLVALVASGVVAFSFSVIRGRPPLGGLLGIALLYSLLLPPNLPLGMVALGAATAILSREIFGGFKHVFHPALVGKALLLILFPVPMSQWTSPFWGGWGGFFQYAPTELASAAPLMLAQSGEFSLWQFFIGNVPGALGATSGLLMLLAGGWLLFTRAVDWRISLVMIATVAVGQSLLEMFFPTVFRGGWLIHLLTGSLLFTAFFIATDPVTSPMMSWGRWLYAILIGILILILRGLTPDPEGVTFSVLVMNAFVPLIDKYTKPKSFGGRP